jgi:hypothetical protein
MATNNYDQCSKLIVSTQAPILPKEFNFVPEIKFGYQGKVPTLRISSGIASSSNPYLK